MTAVLNGTSAAPMQNLLDDIEGQPDHDVVSVQIGRAYLAFLEGDSQKAMNILNDASQGNGRSHKAELLFMKGLLHKELGENERAMGDFTEAQNSEPPLWLSVRINEELTNMGG
jgi:tetratricopeptide (TPR) repeat protein